MQNDYKCSLGPMHGMASTFTNSDGVRCCDFCSLPVPQNEPPAELVEIAARRPQDRRQRWLT